MSYRRGWIAVFLFTLAMINYMDRIALSIAAKPIATEFHLSAVQMGYLFSSNFALLNDLLPDAPLVTLSRSQAVTTGLLALPGYCCWQGR